MEKKERKKEKVATFEDIEYQGLLLRLCMRACKRAEAKKEREIVGPYIYDMAYSALSLGDSALYDTIVFYPYIARSTLDPLDTTNLA